ncbi:hypothetical protein [Halostella litorea]|uniref:hypothetical protein n=1 Tax=Halostella litorea TaxID=2528831 RepID=UPI001091D7A3|nr:hypothetical protein [Halostella litorea]
MFRPPLDPRDRPLVEQPTWRDVAGSYGLIAAVPFLLWFGANPLAGTALLAALVGAAAVVRSAHRLVRCLRNCRRIAFDVGDTARITIRRPPADETC